MLKFVTGLLMVLATSALVCQAAEKSTSTTITIKGEFCRGCLKKVQRSLADVKEISRVDGDVKAKTVTIVPAQGSELSARTLWEMVEKTGKKPAKLVGPQGSFVSKPGG